MNYNSLGRVFVLFLLLFPFIICFHFTKYILLLTIIIKFEEKKKYIYMSMVKRLLQGIKD